MLRAEALQRPRGRMAIPVVAAHRHHRHSRGEFLQPGRAARGAAAMVAHLEEGHMADAAPQPRLSRLPRVAHEDGAERTITHEQHHRIFVQVGTPFAPRRIGVEHGELDAVDGESLAAASCVPRRSRLTDDPQHLTVRRVGAGGGRLDDRPHWQGRQHGPQAAHMIEVGM